MANRAGSPDFLQVAWRRKTIVMLCLVLGTLGGVLFYVKCPPTYQSDAQVLVVKKRPDVVTGVSSGETASEDFLATHRVLIQSPLIVERAINKGNFTSLKTFVDDPANVTESLIKKLTVSRAAPDVAGSANSVLSLSFRGPVADDCGTVINAVLDSYRSYLDETYRDTGDDTLKIMTEARKVLNQDLEKRTAEYRAFREKSPMLWKGKDEINPLQDRLTQIETQRSTLLLRKADLEGQLKTLENATKAKKSHDELQSLVFQLASKEETSASSSSDHGTNTTFKDRVLPLLLEDQTLSADFGPNHPQVQSVRTRIDAVRNFSVLPASSFISKSKAGEVSDSLGNSDAVTVYTQYLNQEHDRTLVQEQTLAKLYQSEHDEARKLNSYEIQDAEFRDGIAATKALRDGLVKRLQDAGMVKESGGYEARVIASAGIGKKISPSLAIVLSEGILLGLLCGACLAYLVDITDKRYRNLDDVRRSLNLPVVACIPRVAAVSKRKAIGRSYGRMLTTHHQPGSIASESYRGVRAALYFSGSADDQKVVQFTSPMSGDGKSTVAANLAVSIAQSGKKILLIDADMRKPRLHEIFSLPTSVGLASVISGETEYPDAIQSVSIPNLSILPCGPLPANPAELLTSTRFTELLSVFREQYDYVLVDSPPVLSVTDAAVIAHQVDGVLMVVRSSKHGQATAERARDILSALGANILGVVLNATEKNGVGEYGYGSTYGAAYGAAYGGGLIRTSNGVELQRAELQRAELNRGKAVQSIN